MLFAPVCSARIGSHKDYYEETFESAQPRHLGHAKRSYIRRGLLWLDVGYIRHHSRIGLDTTKHSHQGFKITCLNPL